MKYPSAPGATYNGKFDNGVPGVRAASTDDANYMNAVYDEIINVITAGGLVPDENDLTQLMKAIQSAQLTGGRLLNVQVFAASGTYTPTPGTRKIIVEGVGGGGASGGVAATGAGQNAISGAGGAGAYGKALFTSGFSGVAVTIGAAGVPGPAGTFSGGNGGTTSFGALMSIPGGAGGLGGAETTGVTNAASGQGGAMPSGANIFGSVGATSAWGVLVAIGYALGSQAVPSQLGMTWGGSGYGMFNTTSAAALAGLAGKQGLLIVWEYA